MSGAGPGVTSAAQAIPQLQGAATQGLPGSAVGSTGFVPPAGALQSFQAQLQGANGQNSGGPAGAQQFLGAPNVGGSGGFQQLGAQAFQNSTAGLANPTGASMPAWQQGLMAAMSGNPQYGQNAPMIHQALAGMTGGGQGGRAAGAPPPQGIASGSGSILGGLMSMIGGLGKL